MRSPLRAGAWIHTMSITVRPAESGSPGKNRPVVATLPALRRPRVAGKFIFAGSEKLYIKGVAYGPFRAEADGSEYHTPESVDLDFSMMAARGINCVRTYSIPPRWLLDIAQRHRLRVMIGIPWEQHITFLDRAETVSAVKTRVREAVRSCSGHPSVLCFSVGNEIPATVV